MLFDNLVACFSPLVPEYLRNDWATHGEKKYGRQTGVDTTICSDVVDSHLLHASRQKETRLMNSVNANLHPLGPYMLSMNRKIAPLASYSNPEIHLPLDVAPRKSSLKRKDVGHLWDGEVLPDGIKKRRVVTKSPRNSKDAYSDALALKEPSYESDVDRFEVMKERKDSMASLLIKKRGNIRFQLPKAETKVVRRKRSLFDFLGQKDSGTLPLYNSAFAMIGSLPRVKSPLWLSEISDYPRDNSSDGNEDSFQSTLVPTPSGSIDYSPGKTNNWMDYDRGSSFSAGSSEQLFNPVLVPGSDSDKARRIIESEDSSDISSGSDACSGSEEEERPWPTINSEEEVERQLEVISESESSEGYREAVGYKGSSINDTNVMQTNGQGVELSRGTHRSCDWLPGENLLCSEDGKRRLLKVSIKTLLDIGNGSFQGALLKPKTTYQGKEINFLRQV